MTLDVEFVPGIGAELLVVRDANGDDVVVVAVSVDVARTVEVEIRRIDDTVPVNVRLP